MSKARSSTIYLKGNAKDWGVKEGVAIAAINPGHLVERKPTGFQKVGTAGIKTAVRVAIEDDFQGKTINDAYATGENVRTVHAQKGDEVQLKLAASAAAIVVGDKLEAAADGTVRKLTTGEVLAEALEAVDNSAGGTEVFINAEVL